MAVALRNYRRWFLSNGLGQRPVIVLVVAWVRRAVCAVTQENELCNPGFRKKRSTQATRLEKVTAADRTNYGFLAN